MAGDFDQTISINLKRDEAIVLLWYLTRELWSKDQSELDATFVHPAEAHGLEALLQELAAPLGDTGEPSTEGIEVAAREHLLKRFTV